MDIYIVGFSGYECQIIQISIFIFYSFLAWLLLWMSSTGISALKYLLFGSQEQTLK